MNTVRKIDALEKIETRLRKKPDDPQLKFRRIKLAGELDAAGVKLIYKKEEDVKSKKTEKS